MPLSAEDFGRFAESISNLEYTSDPEASDITDNESDTRPGKLEQPGTTRLPSPKIAQIHHDPVLAIRLGSRGF